METSKPSLLPVKSQQCVVTEDNRIVIKRGRPRILKVETVQLEVKKFKNNDVVRMNSKPTDVREEIDIDIDFEFLDKEIENLRKEDEIIDDSEEIIDIKEEEIEEFIDIENIEKVDSDREEEQLQKNDVESDEVVDIGNVDDREATFFMHLLELDVYKNIYDTSSSSSSSGDEEFYCLSDCGDNKCEEPFVGFENQIQLVSAQVLQKTIEQLEQINITPRVQKKTINRNRNRKCKKYSHRYYLRKFKNVRKYK